MLVNESNSFSKESTWYEVHLGPKKFQIHSAAKQEQIRAVERKIAEVFEQLEETYKTLNDQNLAFLLALNLADELVRKEEELEKSDKVRMEALLHKLQSALQQEGNSSP